MFRDSQIKRMFFFSCTYVCYFLVLFSIIEVLYKWSAAVTDAILYFIKCKRGICAYMILLKLMSDDVEGNKVIIIIIIILKWKYVY